MATPVGMLIGGSNPGLHGGVSLVKYSEAEHVHANITVDGVGQVGCRISPAFRRHDAEQATMYPAPVNYGCSSRDSAHAIRLCN